MRNSDDDGNDYDDNDDALITQYNLPLSLQLSFIIL